MNEYGVPNYVAYPNTDWFDEVFDTGYSQEHNLSVSGTSDMQHQFFHNMAWYYDTLEIPDMQETFHMVHT